MGNDGDKVLAVAIYRDELLARSACVVGGVICAEKEGLTMC